MTNLFRTPTNALESLIISAELWEITCEWQPVIYKKHTGAEMYMHRRTRQYQPDVWCPLFNNVIDEEESEDI